MSDKKLPEFLAETDDGSLRITLRNGAVLTMREPTVADQLAAKGDGQHAEISLAGNLPQMRKLNAMQQPGMSGQLSVDPQGNIVRMLDWATYQNGKLVSDSAAPQLEDATHEEATDTTSPAVVEPVAVGSDEQGTAL